MTPSESIAREIEAYWRDHRHCTQVQRHIPEGSDTMRWIDSQLAAHPWFGTRFNVVSFAAKGIYEPPRCRACGMVLRIDNAREGKIYCSGKCASNDKEVREKTKATLVDRYGSTSIMGSEELKSRQHASMKEKYGSEFTMTSGVLNAKRNDTIRRKYGVDHYAKTDEFKEKMKSTCLERYGVDSYSKTDEFRSNTSERHHKQSYEFILKNWSEYVIPMFSVEEFDGIQKIGKIYRWKCVKCGLEFDYETTVTGFQREISNGYMPMCPNCYPRLKTSSIPERELVGFIKSNYTGEVITDTKKILPSKHEIDIYIPSMKIGIEFDGLYWHSETTGTEPDYHLKKTEESESIGIRMFHIFEDEWINHKQIIQDRIMNILGQSNKIYARNCQCHNISLEEANDFLSENHLQGKSNSLIQYGLYHNDDLVFVMTFGKPEINVGCEWEMMRFTAKNGYSVLGGASKIIKAFSKEHAGNILTIADRRYGIGDSYEKIGFKPILKTQPNYWWGKYKTRINPNILLNNGIDNMLKDKFNPALSFDENMVNAGYDKIYDCGNIIYIWRQK